MDEKTRRANGSFAEGFIDGWLSIPGSGPPPAIPGHTCLHVVAAGKTPYEAGYERARAMVAEKFSPAAFRTLHPEG